MPFTPAHALAAIPFARGRFALSALVIGTMVPDFSKIITLSPATDVGHSWFGILWFCTPVGLGLTYVYHAFLKTPLFALMPLQHQRRLYPWLNTQPLKSNLTWSILSVAAGATTHLLWDSFTHAHGFGVQLFPALQATVYQSATGPLPVYKILQHGSTVGGLSALVGIYLVWLEKAPACDSVPQSLGPTDKRRVLTRMLWIACGIAAVVGFYQAYGSHGIRWLQLFAGKAAVSMMGVIAVELMAFSIWFWFFRQRQ